VSHLANFAVLLAVLAALTFVGMREHAAHKASRRRLLSRCEGLLDASRLTIGSDGFPRLAGQSRGREVLVELILDTMTIRRLPQLWLSVTLLDRAPRLPGLALLVRPSGNDYYSLTNIFSHPLAAPAGFPAEIIVRGESADAAAVLACLAESLRALFSDPRIKEVAITANGLRVIRQTGEGKRGEHLLLRQAVFEDAEVSREDLAAMLAPLHAMRALLHDREACRV